MSFVLPVNSIALFVHTDWADVILYALYVQHAFSS